MQVTAVVWRCFHFAHHNIKIDGKENLPHSLSWSWKGGAGGVFLSRGESPSRSGSPTSTALRRPGGTLPLHFLLIIQFPVLNAHYSFSVIWLRCDADVSCGGLLWCSCVTEYIGIPWRKRWAPAVRSVEVLWLLLGKRAQPSTFPIYTSLFLIVSVVAQYVP